MKKTEEIAVARLCGEALNAEEEAIFAAWYEEPENRRRYCEWQKLRAAVRAGVEVPAARTEAAWRKVAAPRRPLLWLRRGWKYAAVACLLAGVGMAFYRLRVVEKNVPLAQQVAVEPGRKQAVLTLSTGKRIPLTDSVYRTVTKENGTVIRNDSPNMLVYDAAEGSQGLVYNTVAIPRGGEYKLTLADGTTVWLNADTRLTFPVAFNGARREVKLEGEAFFEVAKDTLKPFIIHTRGFDVRVTGTRFNVRTYPEEPESATLLEGGIRLEKGGDSYRLEPGQQAVVGEHSVRIRAVDPADAVAWRSEAFSFREESLEHIMNELCRWYDVEVFYQNPDLKELHFTAWFRRNSSLEEVIGILMKTRKSHINLNGRTIVIKK